MMMRRKMVSVEMDKRLRNVIVDAIKAQIGTKGMVRITTLEVRGTELEPSGLSFIIHVAGVVVPKDNEEKTP